MISILGCGWLGLPLGEKLSYDYTVKGSTTSLEKLNVLKNSGINPFLINILDLDKKLDAFLDSEILIINIPISNKNTSTDSFNHLKEQLYTSRIRKILFISSTSVYQDLNHEVDENSEIQADNINFKIEEILRSLPKDFSVTVLRLGGLIGPNRHPGRFFSERTQISQGLNPVNLIHLDDCIAVITQIIKRGVWNEIFNVCYPDHPTRAEFYERATNQYCGKSPLFVEEKGQYKTVCSEKLVKKLGYTFRYKDLFHALESC